MTHINTANDLNDILQYLGLEIQNLFINMFQTKVYKIVILETSVDSLIIHQLLLRNAFESRNLYNQLISTCDEKACGAFVLSLAIDHCYIKRDFDNLFKRKTEFVLFPRRIQPDAILGKILGFPEATLKKLFNALELEFDDVSKKVRKRNLKSYIHGILALPSEAKKTKFAAST
jgi:hypothetical protein